MTQDLNSFVEAVKKLQSTLIKAVLSSFAVSTLAVLAQSNSNFDRSFLALTELIAGVAGMAGILSAFLSELHRPMDAVERTLSFTPGPASFRVVLGTFFAAGCYWMFYRQVKLDSELCLLFLSIGNFVFFRTIAGAVTAIRASDAQRQLWAAMDGGQRKLWLERQETLRKLIETSQERSREIETLTRKVTEDAARWKRDHRRAQLRRFGKSCARCWLSIRKKLAGTWLLTTQERIDLQLEKNAGKEAFERALLEHQLQAAQRILKDAPAGQTIEGSAVRVWREGPYWFARLNGPLMASEVAEYVKVRQQISRMAAIPNPQFTLLAAHGAEISLDAETDLAKHDITVFREDEVLRGTASDSPTAS